MWSVTNYHGYVYKPNTPEELVCLADVRSYRALEAANDQTVRNGWNPRDVFTFSEIGGIDGVLRFSESNEKLTDQEIRTIALWNETYFTRKASPFVQAEHKLHVLAKQAWKLLENPQTTQKDLEQIEKDLTSDVYCRLKGRIFQKLSAFFPLNTTTPTVIFCNLNRWLQHPCLVVSLLQSMALSDPEHFLSSPFAKTGDTSPTGLANREAICFWMYLIETRNEQSYFTDDKNIVRFFISQGSGLPLPIHPKHCKLELQKKAPFALNQDALEGMIHTFIEWEGNEQNRGFHEEVLEQFWSASYDKNTMTLWRMMHTLFSANIGNARDLLWRLKKEHGQVFENANLDKELFWHMTQHYSWGYNKEWDKMTDLMSPDFK